MAGRTSATETIILLVCVMSSVVCRKPNIVIMIADDLGIGDVGCFGNTTLKTPNIDSIGTGGVKLTQHLTASSLCSPSRAALLTGRYPARIGMAPPRVVRVGLFTASSFGLPPSEVTYAELAKEAGYSTALIGKWHQGWSRDKFNDFIHHPSNQGFDYFYGLPLTNLKDFGDDGDMVVFSAVPYFTFRLITICLVVSVSVLCLYKSGYVGFCLTVFVIVTCLSFSGFIYLLMTNMKLLSSHIYRNYDLVESPIDLETQMRKEVAEGKAFLNARKADDNPFLLVMSWMHVHSALSPSKQFRGISANGKYGDSVEELDWAVGEILQTLKQLDMESDTLVYFTSDNGGHLEERGIHGEVEGGYNGIYRGGKGHCAVDGGIRVPTLMKWPGRIRPGTECPEATSQMDVLPTLAHIMDVPLPPDRQMDGRNILDLVKGNTRETPHMFLFHYCGVDIHAIRYMPGDGSSTWKLVLREPNYLPGTQQCEYVCSPASSIIIDPPHLYDMTADPAEQRPMNATDKPVIYKTMLKAMEKHLRELEPAERRFSFQNLMWKPWLQMCCHDNYPTCECQDDTFRGVFS